MSTAYRSTAIIVIAYGNGGFDIFLIKTDREGNVGP